MAKLRPITLKALTDVHYDINSRDIIINEGEQYKVAAKLFSEDKNGEILYFYYWSDADIKSGNGFYTYPIERSDIEFFLRNGGTLD